jgi:hypothetical protein
MEDEDQRRKREDLLWREHVWPAFLKGLVGAGGCLLGAVFIVVVLLLLGVSTLWLFSLPVFDWIGTTVSVVLLALIVPIFGYILWYFGCLLILGLCRLAGAKFINEADAFARFAGFPALQLMLERHSVEKLAHWIADGCRGDRSLKYEPLKLFLVMYAWGWAVALLLWVLGFWSMLTSALVQ